MRAVYFATKLMSRFSRNRREYMSAYFRKNGVIVGERCNICSDIVTSEPYLVKIGDDTTISTEVLFLTHDASVGKIFGKEKASDICGKINIGKNCFIGARSTLLYGVSLADDTIVAAGSVVTKSVTESGKIIGGNPARIIGTWDAFAEKYKDKTYALHGKKGERARRVIECNPEKLIRR